MNLKKVIKALNKLFNRWGIDFDINTKRLNNGREKVEATSSLTLKGYDDNIYARFSFYETGVAEYLFTFDQLVKNSETLNLVNTFNEESLWFKAFIDDKYLQITHTVLNMEDDQVADYTNSILEEMADDGMKEYLTPLTMLTVGE